MVGLTAEFGNSDWQTVSGTMQRLRFRSQRCEYYRYWSGCELHPGVQPPLLYRNSWSELLSHIKIKMLKWINEYYFMRKSEESWKQQDVKLRFTSSTVNSSFSSFQTVLIFIYLIIKWCKWCVPSRVAW